MTETAAIKREFELDRMIFFSDAVFAIAITLLVLDIKFPELGVNNIDTFTAFLPMIGHFGAFVVSFIFIASMWYRHLQLFRLLRAYDVGLVIRNLIFIFFIVCFPFVVGGLSQAAGEKFLVPFVLYLVNIALTVFMYYMLCRYLVVVKPSLCIAGSNSKKKYMLLQSQHTAIIFLITIIVSSLSYYISNGNFMAFVSSMYVLPILLAISKSRLKKYKLAAKLENEQQKESNEALPAEASLR